MSWNLIEMYLLKILKEDQNALLRYSLLGVVKHFILLSYWGAWPELLYFARVKRNRVSCGGSEKQVAIRKF